MSQPLSEFAHLTRDLTRSALKPRNVLTHVIEFSLFGGIVTAMAIGVMRLQ